VDSFYWMEAIKQAVLPTPETLLERFGLAAFRPGQREAVQAALDGRDSLVVMPTGGGKSLCYQLPALAADSDPARPLVVVVSPLIALMADQLLRCRQAGVNATMLASGMDDGHNEQALGEIRSGATQLVLAAPERFASRAFREALARRKVGLFVVDEAHCVAEWGHDFRPDYLRLHDAIAMLGRPPVMAATATATPRVAQEIAARLQLREWLSIRSGFDRPSLAFDVVSVEGKGAVARKRAVLSAVLSDRSEIGRQALPAIVYCGTRKDTDELTATIAGLGLTAVGYHAGMSPQARRASQEAFMEGSAEVVVATNAFGMGVDKADVRTVIHWALPTSLEAYYQEAGRGGRDGKPARALLLSARMDLGRLVRFINERDTSVEDVKRYVGRLRGAARDEVVVIGRGELTERERILLSIAERSRAVQLQPDVEGGLRVRLTGQGSPRAANAAIREAKDRSWESYRSIERYMASGEICRRRQILDHFGDMQAGAPSGRCCDVCDPDPELDRIMRAPLPKARARRALGSSGAGQLGEPVDQEQLEQLKVWRSTRTEGKPAYLVASNAVLEEILRRRPQRVEQLIEVRGIGPAFCDKHGESLLAELQVLAKPAGERSAGPGGEQPPAVDASLASEPAPT
jgi:ATP-dependent DNA helicase RecQ